MSLNHVNLALRVLLVLACLSSMSCRESAEDRLRRDLEQRASQGPAKATVAMGYIHQGSADTKSATIQVDGLYLVTSAIEMHGCEPGHDRSLGFLRRLLWPIPEAHAHVPSSATRLGVPFVEDLLAPPNTARMVGGIAPPFGTYCRMYAILAPADDDVLNLTSASPEEIEGHTLIIEGQRRVDEAAVWTRFRLTSAARFAVEMELIDADTHEPPLDLSRAGAHALVLVEKEIPPNLFEGLEGADFDEDGLAETILERLVETFRMYRYQDAAP